MTRGTNSLLLARLARPGGDAAGFAAIREAFAARNPSCSIAYVPRLSSLTAPATAIVFVHAGETRGEVGDSTSDLGVGDVVLLRPGESLTVGSAVAALVFHATELPPDDVPTFLRPDWDPEITDTPGGCATDTDAYRRVVLTWLDANGPYTYRALNAHRVRMTDSFSHYHPLDGGFDELYLVQGVRPGARVITSSQVTTIESSAVVAAEQVPTLVEQVALECGDLCYMPRGVMHRGIGGVLAHVITVPGFVPGSEIGVDHHLRRINERFGLEGEAALPFHAAAAARPVVR